MIDSFLAKLDISLLRLSGNPGFRVSEFEVNSRDLSKNRFFRDLQPSFRRLKFLWSLSYSMKQIMTRKRFFHSFWNRLRWLNSAPLDVEWKIPWRWSFDLRLEYCRSRSDVWWKNEKNLETIDRNRKVCRFYSSEEAEIS